MVEDSTARHENRTEADALTQAADGLHTPPPGTKKQRAALRPKTRVDWSAHKLLCPAGGCRGLPAFATLEAFMSHCVFECPQGQPGRVAKHKQATEKQRRAARDIIPTKLLKPSEPTAALRVVGYVDGDIDADRMQRRAYAVTVTVSPDNTWYTPANTLALLRAAVNVTDGPVTLMVSDTINCLNRGIKDKPLAAGVATELRNSLLFQDAVRALIDADAELVDALQARGGLRMVGYNAWAGCANARRDRDAVMRLYDADDEFAALVDEFASPWADKPWRPTTEYHRACAIQYFLEELASLCVTTSAEPELEVYADGAAFDWCAPRAMALEKLFHGRARRQHALVAAQSISDN